MRGHYVTRLSAGLLVILVLLWLAWLAVGYGSIHGDTYWTVGGTHREGPLFHASTGDTIDITYDVVVTGCRFYQANGRDCRYPSHVSFTVWRDSFPISERVWAMDVESSESAEVTVSVPRSGLYCVSMELGLLEGEADVSWRVRRGIAGGASPALFGLACALVLGLALIAVGVLIPGRSRPGSTPASEPDIVARDE
jgi:hypothetical protein